MTAEEAQQVLQEAEKAKVQAFQEAYQKLVTEMGFGMSPVITITANGVQANLEIVKVKL